MMGGDSEDDDDGDLMGTLGVMEMLGVMMIGIAHRLWSSLL